MDLKLKFFNNYTNRNVLKLGVIYIPSSNPSNPDTINYDTNEYFLKIVDTMVSQLSINDIELVRVPLNIPNSLSLTDEITKKKIYTDLSSYKDLTYFISSVSSPQLEILQEVYFRYNKRVTLLSTGSSQTSLKFNDNIIRFLASDYTLVNFIANYYLHDTTYYYDCVFIGGFFPELEGKPIFGGPTLIKETITYMNEYLNLTNRKLIINPIITDNDNNLNTNTIINQNINTLDFKKNPNYYKTNYYSNYIIQYIQNSPSSNSSQEYINIFNQWVKDYPSIEVTNWKVFESFILPNMTVDPNKWAIIYHFMLYISLFDYTQKKQILLFMSNFQFPAFLSIINYLSSDFENIFNVKNVLYNFQNNSSIIFTNTQNRDQFTSDLLSDSRTDTLWYNNGNTFMNLLDLFKPRIFFPRYDQSMNVFINKLSLELDMYSTNNTYIDLAESSQILLIPIYNAIQFLFHFYRNGVSINSFIFDYFSKSKLLRFGNNLIFDTNMDNVYDIVVGTSYFNSEDTIINRNIHRNIINIFINLRVLNYENSDTIINESDIIVVNDEMILKKEKFTLIDNWARLYNLVKGSTTISDMNAAFRNDKQYQGYNLNIKVNGIVITDSNNRQNILNDQIIINSFNYYFVNGFTLTQTNKPISSN
jgi:hypothetical protein